MLVACSESKKKNDLSVNLEILKKADCNKFCYDLKVTFKNHTNKKIYIPKLRISDHLLIIDNLGRNVFSDYWEEESYYYKEHITVKREKSEITEYDGNLIMKYDTNQISHKQYIYTHEYLDSNHYSNFLHSALKLDMDKMIRKYSYLKDNICMQKDIKELLASKYMPILLEPYSVQYEVFKINTLYHSKEKFNIYLQFDNQDISKDIKIRIRKNAELVNQEDCSEDIPYYDLIISQRELTEYFLEGCDFIVLEEDINEEIDNIIVLEEDYPENIEGYSLFRGVLIFDTLIVGGNP